MRIHIRRHNKPQDMAQLTEYKRVRELLAITQMALYAGRKQKFRVLCGSV